MAIGVHFVAISAAVSAWLWRSESEPEASQKRARKAVEEAEFMRIKSGITLGDSRGRKFNGMNVRASEIGSKLDQTASRCPMSVLLAVQFCVRDAGMI